MSKASLKNAKKITLVFVPEGGKKIKQLVLPKFLLILSCVLVFVGSGFSAWLIKDYTSMKSKMPLLDLLQKNNALQKEQFTHLAKRINAMTSKLGELKEFDHRLKVMVNLESEDDENQFQGVGGSDSDLLESNYSMIKSQREMVRQMHRSLDSLGKEITVGKLDKEELHKYLENQKTLLASTPSIWPTRGWVSSSFGYRNSPFTGEREFHRGIDISTRMNAPILAPADGVVSVLGRNRASGNYLRIKHGYGLTTKYGHLQKVLVKRGQFVKRGETIALVGNTGRSTGPHLHYEVHLNRVPINPTRYILN